MKENKYHQGFFRPQNPEKYMGDPKNIIYRSSYELKFMQWCDRTENILKYSSEEFSVSYYNPVKRKVCRYFPDFMIEVREVDNKIQKYIIEIKPEKQVKEPVRGNKKTKTYITEMNNYLVNQSKWKAIQEWCDDHLIKFRIITEKELGIRTK